MKAGQSKPGARSASFAVSSGLYIRLSSRCSTLVQEALAISVSRATTALALAAGLGHFIRPSILAT